ncbi:MAG: hypothetical protein CL833_01390 [Crocinitomicaceae bacterium]|nr:hypothetical protein [Crocinitomicaceae bacterium]
MNKFHIYLKELREKKFKNTTKFVKILKIDHSVWRKIERGINPPPKKSLLSRFCTIVGAKEYEKSQLFALAKRWEPHPDTNSMRHTLYNRGLDEKWTAAILADNTPDYPHKYWG